MATESDATVTDYLDIHARLIALQETRDEMTVHCCKMEAQLRGYAETLQRRHVSETKPRCAFVMPDGRVVIVQYVLQSKLARIEIIPCASVVQPKHTVP